MPDGIDYHFSGEIREAVPYTRIVQTFEYEGMVSLDSMTLTERDGRTILSGTSTFPSREAVDGMIESGMEMGMSEGYERLDELLATLS
jgi:uncharacterized protein YndB with AHSA1/START domain